MTLALTGEHTHIHTHREHREQEEIYTTIPSAPWVLFHQFTVSSLPDPPVLSSNSVCAFPLGRSCHRVASGLQLWLSELLQDGATPTETAVQLRGGAVAQPKFDRPMGFDMKGQRLLIN